jgi:type I restriction enzyme R subunit
MTPSNFSFLEHEFPILHNIASAAEYHLYADPVTALFKLRQLGEKSAELCSISDYHACFCQV